MLRTFVNTMGDIRRRIEAIINILSGRERKSKCQKYDSQAYTGTKLHKQ
jgi:hypothetical protein